MPIHWLVRSRNLIFTCLFFTTTSTSALQCQALQSSFSGIRPGSITMLGEVHGTIEGPEAAGRFVCQALKLQRLVVVFLEFPEPEQLRLDGYLAGNGDLASQRALIGGSPFWEPLKDQDGRRSVAVFRLIENLRKWRQAGAQLKVVAFDPGTPDRDELMAARVRAERVLNPDAVLITYTGNIHTMLRLPSDFPPDLALHIPPTMGSHLLDLNPVAINLSPTGGLAWMQSVDGKGRVGVNALHDPQPAIAPSGKIIWTPVAEVPTSPFSGELVLPRAQPSIPATLMFGYGRDLR